MASIGSTARVLAVMEALASASDDGVVAQTVIEKSGLPGSTVYRLLAELEEAGLIHRTPDRRMHPNFTFERRLSFRHISAARIVSACRHLSDAVFAASEVITFSGHNLWWHLVQQHETQAIRLRAHPGYAREPYELDSISRLALSFRSLAQIEKIWDTTAFFSVGVQRARLSWPQVRNTIESVDRDGMQFDLQGNAKGVRRFCIALRDGDRFGCLLTVAEAAIPLRDTTEHVERMRALLTEQRDAIEAAGPAVPGEMGEAGAA